MISVSCSLRTLCRALSYAASNYCNNFLRSLYEVWYIVLHLLYVFLLALAGNSHGIPHSAQDRAPSTDSSHDPATPQHS